jgi:hypothetical protein
MCCHCDDSEMWLIGNADLYQIRTMSWPTINHDIFIASGRRLSDGAAELVHHFVDQRTVVTFRHHTDQRLRA